MSEPRDGMRLDPETLAALMEGRLPEDERARVLAVLRDSDADLEVLGDAAAVLAALQEDVSGAASQTVTAGPTRPAVRWKRWLPLAAVLAGLSVIPFLGGPEGSSLAELRRSLEAIGPTASPLGLPPAAGGDVVRSGAGDPLLDSLGATARAFRRGAAFARLTVVAPEARRSSADAAALDALLASSAGSAARMSLDAWYGEEAGDEEAWNTVAQALAGVENAPAAFRMGLLIEAASLLLAEAGRAGATAVLETALEPAFERLAEPVQGALGDAFVRLNDAVAGGDLGSALDAFAERIGTLRPASGPTP